MLSVEHELFLKNKPEVKINVSDIQHLSKNIFDLAKCCISLMIVVAISSYLSGNHIKHICCQHCVFCRPWLFYILVSEKWLMSVDS